MSETISVIIPTYQHGASIGACLETIFAQTRVPDEVIVVDDGSTDDTVAALAPFQNKITYIHQENDGAPAARMKGYEASTGSLVLFCDADVRMGKEMLEQLEKALRDDSEASWAYSSFRWGWKSFPSHAFDPEALKKHNYIHTSSLIRRSAFPGFDLSLKRFQDWDLWLTMSQQGHHGTFVEEELFQVVHQKGRVGMSAWVPAFMFKLPWKTKRVRDHEAAEHIVRTKHHL